MKKFIVSIDQGTTSSRVILFNLKGQIIYSFVHVFHSVLIYSTDMWYLCNQKTLIINLLLFLSIITYEFFISISPVAPAKPEWMFMNIKTTANSLSRSNLFNIFVIFLDALIIVIYDAQRSKYVMLAKKQKRDTLTISFEIKQGRFEHMLEPCGSPPI